MSRRAAGELGDQQDALVGLAHAMTRVMSFTQAAPPLSASATRAIETAIAVLNVAADALPDQSGAAASLQGTHMTTPAATQHHHRVGAGRPSRPLFRGAESLERAPLLGPRQSAGRNRVGQRQERRSIFACFSRPTRQETEHEMRERHRAELEQLLGVDGVAFAEEQQRFLLHEREAVRQREEERRTAHEQERQRAEQHQEEARQLQRLAEQREREREEREQQQQAEERHLAQQQAETRERAAAQERERELERERLAEEQREQEQRRVERAQAEARERAAAQERERQERERLAEAQRGEQERRRVEQQQEEARQHVAALEREQERRRLAEMQRETERRRVEQQQEEARQRVAEQAREARRQPQQQGPDPHCAVIAALQTRLNERGPIDYDQQEAQPAAAATIPRPQPVLLDQQPPRLNNQQVASREAHASASTTSDASSPSGLPPCPVCDEDEAPPRSCCDVCVECQRGWVSSQIGDGRPWPTCSECHERIPYRLLRQLGLSQDQEDDLNRLRRAEQLVAGEHAMERTIWCPRPHCNNSLSVHDGVDEITCHAHHCGGRVCVRHEAAMRRVPGGYVCPTCQAPEPEASDSDRAWKHCPNCKVRIERNGGCPHMTCPCGHEWWWCCLRPYRDDAATEEHFADSDVEGTPCHADLAEATALFEEELE